MSFKRIVSAFLTLSLLVLSFPVFAETEDAIKDFELDGGVITFVPEDGDFEFAVYNPLDDIYIGFFRQEYPASSCFSWDGGAFSINLKTLLSQSRSQRSGDFKITVRALADGNVIGEKECDYSYKSSKKPLDAPAFVAWDGTLVTWGEAGGAKSYTVRVMEYPGGAEYYSEEINDSLSFDVAKIVDIDASKSYGCAVFSHPADSENKSDGCTYSTVETGKTLLDGFISPALVSGGIALDPLNPSVGEAISFTLTGDAKSLSQDSFVFDWQRSPNGAVWTPAQSVDASYTVKEEDVGKFIRLHASVNGGEYTGELYSAAIPVQKQKCAQMPVPPELMAYDDKLFVTNAFLDQEYLVFTERRDEDAMTEDDWQRALTPYEDGELVVSGVPNSMNYVYTRCAETEKSYAGSDVAFGYAYFGPSDETQEIKLEITNTSRILTDEYRIGDVLKITVNPVPMGVYDRAWYVLGGDWSLSDDFGEFFEDEWCKTPLDGEKLYTDVYLKLTDRQNGAKIIASSQLGGVYHSAFSEINIADKLGSYYVKKVVIPDVYLTAGDSFYGEFSYFPENSDISYITVKCSRKGAPEITLTPSPDKGYGAIEIASDAASSGSYVYTVSESGEKLGEFTVTFPQAAASNVSLVPSELYAEKGSSFTLTSVLYPLGSSGKITWSVSDASMASVDSGGVVTVLDSARAGSGFDVIATLEDAAKSASCAVTVKDGAAASRDIFVIDAAGGTISAAALAMPGESVNADIALNRGYDLAFVSVCDKEGRAVKTDETEAGFGFTMPDSAVVITALYEENGESKTEKSPFIDVKLNSYYYGAVIWAVNHDPQITTGTSAVTFNPNNTVTRAQAVTFLWRAAGEVEPESTDNPFDDVSEDDYYFEAVLWAVENGITNGTEENLFSPDLTCSTAHIITFLYRSAGAGNDGWFEDAAAWAADEGLLEDIPRAVSPDVDCPRCDVVTFLYRELN